MLPLRLSAALGVIAVAMLVAWPPAPASAHSFLASTQPVQGARLRTAPEDVALQFSEQLAADSPVLSLRAADAERIDLPPPRLEAGGRVVRQPMSSLDGGVYVVSWHVTSAVDGHQSAGEFAFAVGSVGPSAEELSASATPAGVDAGGAAATWLFFAGLAVAAGGLAGPATVAAAAGVGPSRRSWLHAGTGLAVAGVVAQAALVGVVAGTVASAALAVVFVALLLAPLAARFSSPLPAAGLVTLAAVAWSARSHSAALDGVVGWALDGVHLVAAALWAGALAYVVAALRRRGDRAALLVGIGRYARLGAVLVAVLAATGTVQALRLLPEPSALLTTGYGRIVSVKSALFLAALGAAAVARRRALPAGRPGLLMRLTTGEVGAVAAVLGAAALLVNAAPPQPAAAASLLGPPPMEGPVVHAMSLAGALTVEVKAGADRLDIGVLGTAGGLDGADISLAARYPDGTSADLRPRPCGAGCFTQELELPSGETQLTVSAAAPGWPGGTTTASLRWPPPPEQPQRFDAMVAAMRAVPRVEVAEAVYSGPGGTERRQPQGPGAQLTGAAFVDLMPWAGGGVVDVRPVAGQEQTFSFYLPGSTMLFTVRVDDQDRLVEQRMVNRGHEIDYRFTYPS